MVAACPFPYSRGTPIRIFHLARALAQRGHEIHVVTYHLGDETVTGDLRLHRIPNVRTYRKFSPGPTYQKLVVLDSLLALELIRLLRRRRMDVIHAHHVEGLLAALPARRLNRTPIVFDAHTLLEPELPYYALGLTAATTNRLGRFLDRRLPRRADHTIAVTEDIRLRLLELGAVQADRISVIWNGAAQQLLDLRRMSPQGETRTAIFTGNLASYQGIDLMLQAFASLRATRRDVRLLIVSADRFTDYEVLARDLGIRDAIDVTQAGFDRVPEHLARADIALNPRIDCPGVPQKLLNYMAAGMPIVSFAGSGRFLAAGEHGMVVRDGDTEGFAQAMACLFDDHALARRLGNSARRFAAAELSWSRAAELTEEVYASVLEKTGKSRND